MYIVPLTVYVLQIALHALRTALRLRLAFCGALNRHAATCPALPDEVLSALPDGVASRSLLQWPAHKKSRRKAGHVQLVSVTVRLT